MEKTLEGEGTKKHYNRKGHYFTLFHFLPINSLFLNTKKTRVSKILIIIITNY